MFRIKTRRRRRSSVVIKIIIIITIPSRDLQRNDVYVRDSFVLFIVLFFFLMKSSRARFTTANIFTCRARRQAGPDDLSQFRRRVVHQLDFGPRFVQMELRDFTPDLDAARGKQQRAGSGRQIGFRHHQFGHPGFDDGLDTNRFHGRGLERTIKKRLKIKKKNKNIYIDIIFLYYNNVECGLSIEARMFVSDSSRCIFCVFVCLNMLIFCVFVCSIKFNKVNK